jgi:hypothetical protein
MGRTCSRHGKEEQLIEFCWESQGRKERVERPRRRWEDNIKMDIREIEWGGMDWIHLDLDMD